MEPPNPSPTQPPLTTTQTTPLAPPVGPSTLPPANPPKKNYLPFVLAGLGAIFLIIVVSIASIGIGMIISASHNATPAPTPVPVAPAPIAPVPVVSKFATDSGVLQIQSDLKTLMDNTASVDLIEPQIAPPNLDLNINIKAPQ